MDREYVDNGYTLMVRYMTENHIKTKHRNFLRRLERFYNNNKGKDLQGADEIKYLELEKYFFTNVIPPQNNKQRAMLEFLRLVSAKK